MEETHSQEEGVAGKRPRNERSGTETEAGGEAGPSQSQCKKGHMTNIYLTDEETNEHFKEKVRKDCLWEQLANSYKLSVKVCKTWFDSH